MGILGILTCEILELELAHLLASDPAVSRVAVLEDARSRGLIEALEASGFPHLQRIPHITSFRPEPSEQLEVVVRVLELALHRNKKTLQRALVAAAHELSPRVEALLLGYGLCGNALENPANLLDVNLPVFIPMDHQHPVDDCVGLLIGGRECYYAEQCKSPGTYFMTPGWTRHWRDIAHEDFPGATQKAVDRMFAHYERSLLIVTPVMPEDQMRRNVAEFDTRLGLRLEARQGTLDLLTETWNSAKTYLMAQADPNGKKDRR